MPTIIFEEGNVFMIVLFIPFDLIHPPFCSGFGNNIIFATIMPMPETAMNENYCFVFGQNNIWFSRQNFIMDPKSEPL